MTFNVLPLWTYRSCRSRYYVLFAKPVPDRFSTRRPKPKKSKSSRDSSDGPRHLLHEIHALNLNSQRRFHSKTCLEHTLNVHAEGDQPSRLPINRLCLQSDEASHQSHRRLSCQALEGSGQLASAVHRIKRQWRPGPLTAAHSTQTSASEG